MRLPTEPDRVDVRGTTIVDALAINARTCGDQPAMRRRTDRGWEVLSWGDYSAAVADVVAGLAELGIAKYEKVGILSNNRVEWHLADHGTLANGSVTVPLYQTSSPEQVAYVLGHSEARVCFVENAEQLAKVLHMRDELPKLDRVVVFDDGSGIDDPFVLSFADAPGARAGPPAPRADAVREPGSQGAARRPGHAGLHERDHRAPQGGDDHPRQHHVDDPQRNRSVRDPTGRAPPVLPASVSHRREDDERLPPGRDRRGDLVRPESGNGRGGSARVPAHGLLRRAARLGEAARRGRRQAEGTARRCASADQALRTPRPSPGGGRAGGPAVWRDRSPPLPDTRPSDRGEAPPRARARPGPCAHHRGRADSSGPDPLVPRGGPATPRAVWADRGLRADQRQPPMAQQDRHRRPAGPRCHPPNRRRRRDPGQGRQRLPGVPEGRRRHRRAHRRRRVDALGRSRNRRRRTATSPSRDARRTSSSTRQARTSRRRRSKSTFGTTNSSRRRS